MVERRWSIFFSISVSTGMAGATLSEQDDKMHTKTKLMVVNRIFFIDVNKELS
jgi:hypothetical protein